MVNGVAKTINYFSSIRNYRKRQTIRACILKMILAYTFTHCCSKLPYNCNGVNFPSANCFPHDKSFNLKAFMAAYRCYYFLYTLELQVSNAKMASQISEEFKLTDNDWINYPGNIFLFHCR